MSGARPKVPERRVYEIARINLPGGVIHVGYRNDNLVVGEETARSGGKTCALRWRKRRSRALLLLLRERIFSECAREIADGSDVIPRCFLRRNILQCGSLENIVEDYIIM